MPLDRVPGEQFDVLVDHADGWAGHPCTRGPTPLRVNYGRSLSCRPLDGTSRDVCPRTDLGSRRGCGANTDFSSQAAHGGPPNAAPAVQSDDAQVGSSRVK